MSTETTEQSKRVQLATVVGLTINPARARSNMDKLGMNVAVEKEIAEYKARLLTIKKEGSFSLNAAPVKPTASNGAEVNQTDLDAYTKAFAKYEKDLSAWKAYKSVKYENLVTVYSLYKSLSKLHRLLSKRDEVNKNPETKKKFTVKNTETLKTLTDEVNAPAFAAYRGKLDVNSLQSVQETLDALQKNYPDVSLFIAKDAVSARRIHFNERAAVALATVMEVMVEEMAEQAMGNVSLNGKKIIKPDHCVSPGLEQKSLYPLFGNLPVVQAVRNRQARRVAHEAKVKREQDEANRKAKAAARRNKKDCKLVKIPHQSFEESECATGYATMQVTPAEGDKKSKTKCLWYGIDLPNKDGDVVNKIDFVYYVEDVCRHLLSTDQNWTDIKVSDSIKNFFSDVLVQFIARILPLISLVIKTKKTDTKNKNKNDVKTVCDGVVMRVIEILLADSNHNPHGEVRFAQEHSELFSLVQSKLELLEKYNKECADRKTDQTDEKEEEEEEEDVPLPAPTPVAPTTKKTTKK